MSTSDTDRMPPLNDAAGLTRWHHEHGMPWGPQYFGPEPKVMGRMSRAAMRNITVHLANEHGINRDKHPWEQHHIQHMLAHVYGQFREGQEHYHEEPPA
jgi:hypothetical protein